ncbi:hypothetical protein Tco_0364055 [Tanacetum coccineum]
MGTPTQYLCDYWSGWVRLPRFVCGPALILVLQLVGPLGEVKEESLVIGSRLRSIPCGILFEVLHACCLILDSEDSTVTYTEVSSPFEDLSDIGSLGVIVHGYDGLPMMPEDPYAYVEAALQATPLPDYVPGPKEPEQAPPQPDFVPETVILLSPMKEDDEDPEEDPADYPTDRDDDDDEEEESFRDDAGDEDEDEEEKEEHLALVDSVPPPVCRTTARMYIRDQTPIPFPSAVEVDRFLAIYTPPSSPLTS